ncbi:MAG TPA: pitrilysin family protein [Tissierellaceae bacterium]|nr:pitrilysin family protein [Tissierellaceae bacterium]
MSLKSQRINIGNGVNLNLIKTDKFKSNLLSYYFIRPLSKKEVTKNALLPLVLKRGTEKYDTNLKIQKRLEENYGSQLSMGINKRGERHVLRFSVEIVDKKYVKGEKHIYNVLELLQSIIFNPTLEKGYFKENYIRQEKENLKRKIQGRINDKRSYALERCIEEMCKNEKFNIYPLGYIEDLKKIDQEVLYNHYKEVINTSPIEIFYTGDYDEKLIKTLKNNINIKRENIIKIPKEKIISSVQTRNMVSENMDVVQGKVVLGFRTGIPYDDKLYNGLLVASDILGGGTNSKLFKNVREQESLAYYINSNIYKYKSIMLIDGGIEFHNFEKTVNIIKEQLKDMQQGIFTDKDIEISKKSLKSSMESIKDSIFLISGFFFGQQLSGDNRSLEEIIIDIENVKREEIIEAASKLSLDTIYFMKDSNLIE